MRAPAENAVVLPSALNLADAVSTVRDRLPRVLRKLYWFSEKSSLRVLHAALPQRT